MTWTAPASASLTTLGCGALAFRSICIPLNVTLTSPTTVRSAVAYHLLFTFQAVGLACFTAAVHGPGWAYWALGVTFVVAVCGPHTPRMNLDMALLFPSKFPDGQIRPVLPLSLSLTIVFAVSVVLNVLSWISLFGSACHSVTFLPGFVLAVVAPLVTAAGGVIEGTLAESTFNQWWHFAAFVVLTAGLLLHPVMYSILLK